jgi:hypothetical protein
MILALLLVLAPTTGDFPTYQCAAVTKPVVVDGSLDDAAWRDAAWTSSFVGLFGPGGQMFEPPATRARFSYDAHNLYVAAELSETDVRAEMTKHDDHLYRENAFRDLHRPGRRRH